MEFGDMRHGTAAGVRKINDDLYKLAGAGGNVVGLKNCGNVIRM